MQPKPIGRRAKQAYETRELIIRVAQRLFAKQGYASTSIDEVLKGAGVARGALYHHFRDKEDLFGEIFKKLLRESHQKVVEAAASSPTANIWDRLRHGREAFLDRWTDPGVCRVLLLDGPSVLSPKARREINESLGVEFMDNALVLGSLRELQSAGEIRLSSFEPLATILGGAFDAAALAIATSEEPKVARAQVSEALNVLVDGLQARLKPSQGGDKASPPRRRLHE